MRRPGQIDDVWRRCARRPTSSGCPSSPKGFIVRRTSISISRRREGRPFHYYAYGAAVSEVEVDGFTGQYRLLRTDILQDVGDSISPVIDRGQIEGGFLQGVGWLTIEELLWDADGRVSSAVHRPTSCRPGPRCLKFSMSMSWSARPSRMSSWAARRSGSLP